MAKKKDFWRSFSENVDFQPAANLIATGVLQDAKDREDADAKFYADQQKRMEDAKKQREQVDALTAYSKGGQDKTSFSRNFQPELRTKYDPDTNQFDVAGSRTDQPLVKARTEYKPYTSEQMIELGLKGGVSIPEILKGLRPKKKEYSKTIEKPHQSLGLSKETNQWEVISNYEDLNPAYNVKYREAEINKLPEVKYVNGKPMYTTDVGLFDPEADVWKTDEKGEKYVLKTTEKNVTQKSTNGEDVLAKELKARMGDFFSSQQLLQAQLDLAHKNPQGMIVDDKGKPQMQPKLDEKGNPELNYLGQTMQEPITAESLKERLLATNKEYLTYARNIASDNLLAWTKTVPIGTDSKAYWKNLVDAYAKGWRDKDGKLHKLSEYDFEVGQEFFKAAFGKNPLAQYGVPNE